MNQHANASQPGLLPAHKSLAALVVGAGRSGSTMLSNLFREHPAVLSLSEFFRLFFPTALSPSVLDGAQFWELIGAPASHLSLFLQRDVPMPEFLYPFKDPSSRFTSSTSVPPILLVSLPHLTNDYEALYDELRPVVLSFPPDNIERQFARLIDWLKHRFGRSVCIERSGLSLPVVSSLIQLFPRAKYVHLVRDGRACAYSMSHHFAFRFMVSMEIPIEPSTSSTASPEKGEDRDDQSSVDMGPLDFMQVLSRPLPVAAFGSFWSRMIVIGVQALLALPEEQVLTIRYEDIVADPRRNLTRLIDFIDPSLQNQDWLERASSMVEHRPSAWEQLPAAEREALEQACQPGQAILDAVLQEGLHSPKVAELLRT